MYIVECDVRQATWYTRRLRVWGRQQSINRYAARRRPLMQFQRSTINFTRNSGVSQWGAALNTAVRRCRLFDARRRLIDRSLRTGG